MGGACGMNGGEEECMQYIGGKGRKKETSRKTKTVLKWLVWTGSLWLRIGTSGGFL
jgi:hypothetical protein